LPLTHFRCSYHGHHSSVLPDFSVDALGWPFYIPRLLIVFQQKILTALWGIMAIFIIRNQEVSITLSHIVPIQGFLVGIALAFL